MLVNILVILTLFCYNCLKLPVFRSMWFNLLTHNNLVQKLNPLAAFLRTLHYVIANVYQTVWTSLLTHNFLSIVLIEESGVNFLVKVAELLYDPSSYTQVATELKNFCLLLQQMNQGLVKYSERLVYHLLLKQQETKEIVHRVNVSCPF